MLLANRRRRTYVQSVFAGYLYTSVNVGVNLALVPILVTGLGKARYGIWLTIVALVQWGTIGTGWLSPGFIKRIGDHLAKRELALASHAVASVRSLYRTIGFAVVSLAVVLAWQPQLGFLGGEVTHELRATILLAAIWLAVQIESQTEIAILTAAQRLYLVYGVQAAVLLASGLGAGLLVLTNFRLPAVASSYAAASLIGLFIYKMTRRRIVGLPAGKVTVDRALIRDISSTTTPYILSVIGWILLSSDILLLAFLTSPATVATYGIAYKMVDTMLQVIWRIADATQPYFVELDALAERTALRRLFARTTEASLILGGSLTAVFFFVGHRLLELWVGTGQAAGLWVVRLLCIYALLQTFVHASGIVPFSIARMSKLGWLQLFEGLLKIALVILLVPTFGPPGVVGATLIAIGVTTAWYAPRLATRILGLRAAPFFLRRLYRSLPLPAAAGAAAYLASRLIEQNSAAAATLAVVVVIAGLAVGAFATRQVRSTVA